ncbi:MAG: hypothetical protein JXR03_03515 [Cyclobacteriaceae bacterium]
MKTLILCFLTIFFSLYTKTVLSQNLKKSHLYVVYDNEVMKVSPKKIQGLYFRNNTFLEGEVRLVDKKFLLNNHYYQLDEIKAISYIKPGIGHGVAIGVKWIGVGVASVGKGLVSLSTSDEDDCVEDSSFKENAALLGSGTIISLAGAGLTYLSDRRISNSDMIDIFEKEYPFLISNRWLSRKKVIKKIQAKIVARMEFENESQFY